MRTIAVTPAISKLYELCILQKLRNEIEEKEIIHKFQRGFVPGKSCEDNLVDLTECMNQAKDLEQAYRRAKTPNGERVKTYLFFVDLKKAFDKVPRNQLVAKLRHQGIRTSLTETIHSVLQGTKAIVDDQTIDMDLGVPQGAVLSPTLFALYINDLVTDLNDSSVCYAFADDLVILAKGEDQLNEAIDKVENWSGINGIDVNRAKSGIMRMRKDGRTPDPIILTFRGYPLVKSYKYLGVTLDNSLNLKLELHRKK